MLRAQYTSVATSCDNEGGQLHSRYNLKPQEVQTLHHGGQLRAPATTGARFDPSTEDQVRTEQRRPVQKETKG